MEGSRLLSVERVVTGDTSGGEIGERVDAPVATGLIRMVATNVRRAEDGSGFVLQIERAVRGTDIGQPPEAVVECGEPWESGTDLTLETKLAGVVILNGLRRRIRVVVPLITCAEMQQQGRTSSPVVVHTNGVAADTN